MATGTSMSAATATGCGSGRRPDPQPSPHPSNPHPPCGHPLPQQRARSERGPGGGSEIPAKPAKPAPAKLSYKESRELDHLPRQIEALEAEQRELAALMASGEYHKRGGEQLRRDAARATEIEQLLEAAFERWAELDMRRNAQR